MEQLETSEENIFVNSSHSELSHGLSPLNNLNNGSPKNIEGRNSQSNVGSDPVFDKFSIVNPHINKTFYYIKQYFTYNDLKKEKKYQFLINQERKFLNLILDSKPSEKFSVWTNLIYWIKSVLAEDSFRIFTLLDKFTETLKDEEKFYKDEQFIILWLEYAQMCEDEVQMYYFMLKKGIFSNRYNVIDRIITHFCVLEDFETAKNIIDPLCRDYHKESAKRKFYEKLRSVLELKICESYNSTIIFPDIINRYLEKKEEITKSVSTNEINHITTQFQKLQSLGQKQEPSQQQVEQQNQIKLVQCSSGEDVSELKAHVDYLVRKYQLVKEFLIKYDEEYKNKSLKINSDNGNGIRHNKPHSWLVENRIKPKLPVYLVMKICDYMQLTEYYKNTNSSLQSALVEYSMLNTVHLPKKWKIEFIIETIEKDCFDYMFKINTLAYTKYDKDNYSTKISLLKFINSNYHTRTISFNYAVKNILYLYGVNENYLALFTPFYFILFDARTLTFVHRHRFEINHYTDENAVLYLFDYNPRYVAFSISSIIYIIHIDNRNNLTIRHKLEGHRDDVNKLFFKNTKGLNILVSGSKTQIILWDLDTTAVRKMFAIDETKLLIKQLLLINLNYLCLMTLYNELYILEFGGENSNNLVNLQLINYTDDHFIFDISNKDKQNEGFVFKLNNNNLSILDINTSKELISYFENEENFKKCDLIFLHKNNVFKRYNKKNKIVVYSLY